MWRPANVVWRCWLCAAIAAAAVQGSSARFVRAAARDEGSRGAAFLGRHQEGNATHSAIAVTHTLRMENYLGVQYIAPITLGNQALKAVYDTGSFDIMAVATECGVCKNAPYAYNQWNSASFKAGPKGKEEHLYVSGKVIAKQDFETVRVGDGASPLVASHTPFWQVLDTDIDVWIQDKARFTVIVGLGHADMVPNYDGTPSGDESLASKVGAQRFAICLERGLENPGWLTINPQLPAAHLMPSLYRTVPVVGENHWATTLVRFEVEGWTANLAKGQNVAIVDSGTSMLGLPSSVILKLTDLINYIDSDCKNMPDLPDMLFTIAGHTFRLPPSAYVLKVSSKISDGTVFDSCIPAFMNVDMATKDGDVWILGMPFLRSHYTVFDRVSNSIHIADQGEGCQPVKENAAVYNFHAHGLDKPSAQAKRRPKLPSELTKADVRAAMRPWWARGGRNGTLMAL